MTSRVRNLQRRARALERRPGRSELEMSLMVAAHALDVLRSVSPDGLAPPQPPLPDAVETWRAANTPTVTREAAIEALRAALGGAQVPPRPVSGELQ